MKDDDKKNGSANLRNNVPKRVVEQLLEKRWSDMVALEHAGYVLFPETLYKCRKDGKFEEIKVTIRVPKQHELRKARVQARQIAVKDGLDLDSDKDLLGDLETVCILSMAIRNVTHPYEPLIPDPEELEKTFDRPTLMQVWAKLDEFHRLIDPAPHEISKEEMFALIAAIAKERNISPLLAYAARSQANFIVFMACELQKLTESKS